MAFVGDPQVDNATQLGYARTGVLNELRGRGDLDLVIFLGDLVNDKMELLAPMTESLDSLGCPWLAVPGNHDRDVYRDGRARDLSSWRRATGYVDTSFVMKGIRFILMNDVRTVGRAGYEAGWSEAQKIWLADILSRCPSGQRIVLAAHIPFEEMHAGDTLSRLLAGKENLLLVTGHTHQVLRRTINIGGREVESLGVGAACGSWWRGFKDARGVPDALMNCGSPRGYFVCDFSRSGYRLAFKAFGSTAVASAGTGEDGRMVVNVFGGSRDGTVKVRRGNSIIPLKRANAMAPEVRSRIGWNRDAGREYFRSHREEFIPLRNLRSPHVWEAADPLVPAPAPGETVTVIYRDRHMRFRSKVRVID